MTDQSRLTALVWPMGAPPKPTDADRKAAIAWVDAWFAREDFCPVWRERNRGYFIDSQARTEMWARLRKEAGRIGADAPTGLSSLRDGARLRGRHHSASIPCAGGGQ